MTEKMNFEHLSYSFSVLTCFIMGSFYVLSLYFWSKQNRFNRNDPEVIKRRFVSVFVTSALCLLVIHHLGQRESKSTTTQKQQRFYPLSEWVGVKLGNNAHIKSKSQNFTSHLFIGLWDLLKSTILPLKLTVILFMGPLVQSIVSGFINYWNETKYTSPSASSTDYLHSMLFSDNMNLESMQSRMMSMADTTPKPPVMRFSSFVAYAKLNILQGLKQLTSWPEIKDKLTDLHWLRNYVVGPLTEEFVFRGCMLPLLVSSVASTQTLVLLTPFFFGLAHLHHIIEGWWLEPHMLSTLITQHSFQFAYSYVFGVYSSYLFLRTGNLMSSVISHSFCNMMGFPNFGELVNSDELKGNWRMIIIACYILGFVLFFGLIDRFTLPEFYGSNVYTTYFV